MVTSIWQTGQTVLSSHLHLSQSVIGLGSVVHSLMPSQFALHHLQILLMKVHCHADYQASSGGFTCPLICSKSASWCPYLLTHPYLILLVVIPEITVFLLETYGYFFCCYGNDLCGCIFMFVVLLAYSKFVVTIILIFMLQMGSFVPVAWPIFFTTLISWISDASSTLNLALQ